MWHFVAVFPHEHALCETWINYRISHCNFIADWTIVLGKISIADLTLATSQLATTDLLEHSQHPGPDFITPHTQRERGKVIDRGVHIYIYICVCGRKKFESYFRDRLTFQTLTVGLLVEFID